MGRFSGYELALSSLWISLAAKISFSRRMDLVIDMDADAKREFGPTNFGMPYIFLYFLELF